MEFTLKTIHIIAVALTVVCVAGMLTANIAIATGALTALGALYAGNNIGKKEERKRIESENNNDLD